MIIEKIEAVEQSELAQALQVESFTDRNDDLSEFVNNSDSDQAAASESTVEQSEKLTETAARHLVSSGAEGIIELVSVITETSIKVSSPEIDCLTKDIAPVVVKYGNKIEQAPPWLKEILKYRVEIMAVKGILLFTGSIYKRVANEKRQQLIELKKLELAQRQLEMSQVATHDLSAGHGN